MGSPIPAMGSPIPAMCSPSSAQWRSEGRYSASLQRSVGGDAADAGRPVGRDAGAPGGGGAGGAGGGWGGGGRRPRLHPLGGGRHGPYTERVGRREESAGRGHAGMTGGQ